MAREHARILCSIWSPTDDFRLRSSSAQRLFFLLLSQRELNNAGVMPLMIGKWARHAPDTSVEDVRLALEELVEHRYVAIDEDTEELLVRTFLRGDGVAKQPNVLTNALRLAEHIESPRLRAVLARELVRLGQPRTIDAARRISSEPIPEPALNGSLNGSPNGSANPSGVPIGNPSGRVDLDLRSTPAGWGGGRGGGRGPVPEVVGVGGTRERATTPPAPPPPAPPLDPTNPRCVRHRDVPADDPGPDCRFCRDARLRVQADAPDPGADAAARRAAIDACGLCDERGLRDLGDLGLGRCTHPDQP